MIELFAMATAGLAVAGSAQCIAGWVAVQQFAHTPPPSPGPCPPVTILKPLHGNEPLLEQALASFCQQDYQSFQIVFGLQDPADAALPVVERLRERFPATDITVVTDPTPHGLNRKVANLVNMLPYARHDIIVIADSDIHAAPDYLTQLVTSLHQPGVGLVTTLYSGLPACPGLTGWLGAEQINHAFLPGALMARGLGRQDCLGATMALKRATLERVGGLPALVDHLADDAELGRLVKAQGGLITLARTVPATTVAEVTLPDLFAHELRWARTILSLAPIGFAMSCLQYPLFWSALTVGLSGGAVWAWMLFAATWLIRGMANIGIDKLLGLVPAPGFWCLPLRDLMSITIMLASVRSDRVAWRGQMLRATRPSLAPGKG